MRSSNASTSAPSSPMKFLLFYLPSKRLTQSRFSVVVVVVVVVVFVVVLLVDVEGLVDVPLADDEVLVAVDVLVGVVAVATHHGIAPFAVSRL